MWVVRKGKNVGTSIVSYFCTQQEKLEPHTIYYDNISHISISWKLNLFCHFCIYYKLHLKIFYFELNILGYIHGLYIYE